MKVLTIVQARVGSTRLPGKVLLPIQGKTILEHVVRAAPEPRVVACPYGDMAIVHLCEDLSVECLQGPMDNVLERFYNAYIHMRAAEGVTFTHVLRLTSDCPLLTLDLTEKFIRATPRVDVNFITTNRPADPDGYDMELFPVGALEASLVTRRAYDLEHVTPYMYRHFPTYGRRMTRLEPTLKLSVDTQADYIHVKHMMEGTL